PSQPLPNRCLSESYGTATRQRSRAGRWLATPAEQLPSELIPLLNPIMPIFNGLLRLRLDPHAFELGQRYPKRPPLPLQKNEHLVLAVALRGHACDFYLVTFPQRRDPSFSDALGTEGKVQFL